jgi:hypothetical protein
VAKRTWYSPYIETFAIEGITEGYLDANGNPTGILGPNEEITLDRAIKFLVLASQQQEIQALYGFNAVYNGDYSLPYSDSQMNPNAIIPIAAIGHWAEPYFRAIAPYELAILQDIDLQMDQPISRIDLLDMIIAIHEITDSNIIQAQQDIDYNDTAAVNAHQLSLIEKGTRLGTNNGYAKEDGELLNLFKPQQHVTTAEAIKMMVIAFQACDDNFEYYSPLVEEYYRGLHGES